MQGTRAAGWDRRAVLEGLSRILDAGAPEELFTGPQDEAMFLYDLLMDAAEARNSSCYPEICRTARRHGVTPDYVVDRVLVLLAAMQERRRTDLYRILGVPPLASDAVIRQSWLEFAKRHHPDAGGNGVVFRHAKQAYDVLRDPDRRAEYERFWLRALGPFERVAPGDDFPAVEAVGAGVRSQPLPTAERATRAPRPTASPDGVRRRAEVVREPPAPDPAAVSAIARLLAPEAAPEPRTDLERALGGEGVANLLARFEAVLAPIRREELDTLAADVERTIHELESLRDQLGRLAELKRSLS